MTLSSFDDLLQAARAQREPQRLLFVFAGIELPEDATPAQRQGFEAGQGGALVPLMCVDKSPDELESFSALAQEARQFPQPWGIVLVAALSGRQGRSPTSEEAEAPLQGMVEAIRHGQIGNYVLFDTQGDLVRAS